MPKTHAPYPAQFRQQIVELARAGRTPTDLAREFGCSAQAVRNWVAQEAIDGGRPPPGKEAALTSGEREELARLRRDYRRLEQERDILVKATAWFAARHDKTSTPSSNS
jgi:transposase